MGRESRATGPMGGKQAEKQPPDAVVLRLEKEPARIARSKGPRGGDAQTRGQGGNAAGGGGRKMSGSIKMAFPMWRKC